ncbi:STM4015 family protein [Herpetosiphon llansteffanensis]|uniref:STM4015 family protein n=1 Tax=Herpetosiphon llansteffanensis TaxID=2094568 RepID=UPI000D7BCDFE|nr:STM4015 family protein [Herpetosiphon llansteffanensis]
MAQLPWMSELLPSNIADWDHPGILQPSGVVHRVGLSYEDDYDSKVAWSDRFADFLALPSVEKTTGLVIGTWWELDDGNGPVDEVVESLVSAAPQLPNLRALFVGDIMSEESEISWIEQDDLSPLLSAFPNLQHFAIRGANGLSLGSCQHAQLKTLVIQSGGLPNRVVQEIFQGKLPALEHLELWLGSDWYGGDVTLTNLEPLLSGELFPQLKVLALRDCSFADDLAIALSQSPIINRIEILDLSLGNLGDEGAKALLACPAIKQLKLLDLHYHFIDSELAQQFKQLGIEVDISEPQDPTRHDDRYIAVSE